METIDLPRPSAQAPDDDPSRRSVRLRWTALPSLIALIVAGVGVMAIVWLSVSGPVPTAFEDAAPRESMVGTIDPYRGMGAWVDVFDFAPEYGRPDASPPVTPDLLPGFASQGARTLFLQAARADASSSDGIVEPDLVGEFLVEAHRNGMDVVAWYAPAFQDIEADLARMEALHGFSHAGHTFDGLAVDIEDTTVSDNEERSRRLVELSSRLRQRLGDTTLGAIVFPPVLLEEVNPNLWPDFPWELVAGHYDVWIPMSYWTFRSEPWRDADVYTATNVDRLRNLVGADAEIHVLGGVADAAADADYRDFVGAVLDADVIGASVYDYTTLSVQGWATLRDELTADVWSTQSLRD